MVRSSGMAVSSVIGGAWTAMPTTLSYSTSAPLTSSTGKVPLW